MNCVMMTHSQKGDKHTKYAKGRADVVRGRLQHQSVTIVGDRE